MDAIAFGEYFWWVVFQKQRLESSQFLFRYSDLPSLGGSNDRHFPRRDVVGHREADASVSLLICDHFRQPEQSLGEILAQSRRKQLLFRRRFVGRCRWDCF